MAPGAGDYNPNLPAKKSYAAFISSTRDPSFEKAAASHKRSASGYDLSVSAAEQRISLKREPLGALSFDKRVGRCENGIHNRSNSQFGASDFYSSMEGFPGIKDGVVEIANRKAELLRKMNKVVSSVKDEYRKAKDLERKVNRSIDHINLQLRKKI